jgi:hypothetical protein
MRRNLLRLLLLATLVLACDKPRNPDDDWTFAGRPYCSTKGLLVGFSNQKCGCCWGWKIKVGKDTITVAKMPRQYQGRHDPSARQRFPLAVKLEIGKHPQRCPGYYQTIDCIRIMHKQ